MIFTVVPPPPPPPPPTSAGREHKRPLVEHCLAFVRVNYLDLTVVVTGSRAKARQAHHERRRLDGRTWKAATACGARRLRQMACHWWTCSQRRSGLNALPSCAPEVAETIRAQLSIANGVLDVAVAEVGLQGPRIMSLVREREAAGVAQHVGMAREAKFRRLTGTLYKPGKARRGRHSR